MNRNIYINIKQIIINGKINRECKTYDCQSKNKSKNDGMG